MNALKSWLAQEREKLIWIDYADYATEIIANGAPWHSAAGIAGLLSQAQSLLKSDVISLDAGRILLEDSNNQSDDPLGVLLAHLQEPSRIQLLNETVDALAHSAQCDLVLQLPGLKKALLKYGADDDTASDFGNLDDLGAVYTDIIRGLADKSLHGLLLTLDEVCGEDEFEALGPVTAAATHYGWAVVSELLDSTQASSDGEYNVGELSLLPQAMAPIEGFEKVGGGLTNEFWMGTKSAGEFALQYGSVPHDGVPEIVLAQRQSL